MIRSARLRRSRHRRRGFVLPTSLLVLTLLTVLLAAAFTLVSADWRTTDNALSTSRATALAQAGMEYYLAEARGLVATSTSDSVRYTLSGGYADVVARKVRDSIGATPSLWSLRATATATDQRFDQPQAKASVGYLANLITGVLPARAAMVAFNGVQLLGSGGNPLDGNDNGATFYGCTPPPGAAADTFSLATITGSYVGGTGGSPGGEGIEYHASQSVLYDSTHIDWSAILSGTFTPDYEIPPSSLPSYYNSTWQIGYVNGDVTITGTGSFAVRRGILVVSGDVIVRDGAHWDGVIIAGGQLRALPNSPSTDFWIHGMIVTGLNCITGGPCPSANQIRRGGSREIQWSYCWGRRAAETLSGFTPLSNSWTDSWALY